jgi:hypothetical protein
MDCKKMIFPSIFRKEFPLAGCWYNVDILKKTLKNVNYDAIIIDGPYAESDRVGIWYYYQSIFDTTVPVIVDDVNKAYLWKIAVQVAKIKKADNFIVEFNGPDKKPGTMFAIII